MQMLAALVPQPLFALCAHRLILSPGDCEPLRARQHARWRGLRAAALEATQCGAWLECLHRCRCAHASAVLDTVCAAATCYCCVACGLMHSGAPGAGCTVEDSVLMGNTCVWLWLTLVKHHVATHYSACGVIQVWGPVAPVSAAGSTRTTGRGRRQGRPASRCSVS